jgi:hypothetical protein
VDGGAHPHAGRAVPERPRAGPLQAGPRREGEPRAHGLRHRRDGARVDRALLAYKDDDDWKKREDWDRDNYWWFKIGDTAYRIPKPFEIGAIGTLAERSLELMISDEMTGKRFAQRMKSHVRRRSRT